MPPAACQTASKRPAESLAQERRVECVGGVAPRLAGQAPLGLEAQPATAREKARSGAPVVDAGEGAPGAALYKDALDAALGAVSDDLARAQRGGSRGTPAAPGLRWRSPCRGRRRGRGARRPAPMPAASGMPRSARARRRRRSATGSSAAASSRLAAGAALGEDEAGLLEPADPVAGDRIGQEPGAADLLGRKSPHRPRQRRAGLRIPAGREVSMPAARTRPWRGRAAGPGGREDPRQGACADRRAAPGAAEAGRSCRRDRDGARPRTAPPLAGAVAIAPRALAALPERAQLGLAGRVRWRCGRGEVLGRAQGHRGVSRNGSAFRPLPF